ncbi:MAG: SDR family oxidoreductase [Rhizobiales bacterium]|nr:SDR family oxidoreductase [Hyphomicrobiales bacterium]
MSITPAPPLAYVTGGTRGIGRAIAARLARDGYRVAVCGSTPESVESCRRWAADEGLAISPHRVDVRDPAELEAAITRAVLDGGADGALRALVCAAGRPTVGSAERLSITDWDDCLDLNLRAAFAAVKAALQALRRSPGAGVVLISSIWAVTAVPERTAYITAKSAMTGLARALALDHARDGIRVNAVAPGFVDTELLRNSIRGRGAEVEPELARLAAGHPLGRLIAPDDIADAAAFLLSDCARNITAQTLVVDGGLTARLTI